MASGPLNQSIPAHSGQAISPQYAKKYMTDVRNLSALKMTEIYEWSLEKGLARLENPTQSSSSSLVNILGFGKSDNLNVSNMLLIRPSQESLLKSKIYFCSYKFRHALILCDMGLLEEALQYANDVKYFIQILTQKIENDAKNPKKSNPPANGKQAPNADCGTPTVKQNPFSKGFINSVHELIDRLTGGSPKNKGSSTGSSTNSTGSSSWNVWNVFSSANLKDLVDGPSTTSDNPPQLPPPVNKLAPPPIKSTSGPPPPKESAPPMKSTYPPYDYGQIPPGNGPPPMVPGTTFQHPILNQPPTISQPPPITTQPPPTFNQPPPTIVNQPPPTMNQPPLKSSISTGDLRGETIFADLLEFF